MPLTKVVKVSSNGSLLFQKKDLLQFDSKNTLIVKKDDRNFHLNQKKATSIIDLKVSLAYKTRYLK